MLEEFNKLEANKVYKYRGIAYEINADNFGLHSLCGTKHRL